MSFLVQTRTLAHAMHTSQLYYCVVQQAWGIVIMEDALQSRAVPREQLVAQVFPLNSIAVLARHPPK